MSNGHGSFFVHLEVLTAFFCACFCLRFMRLRSARFLRTSSFRWIMF